MKKLLFLVCIVVMLPAIAVADLPRAEGEVTHLLEFVQQSDCQFHRNGTWYSADEARAHLQKKYAYLVKKGWANKAEDFIERAATKSSLSGRAYQVKCGSEPQKSASGWLTDELRRYRKTKGAKNLAARHQVT